MQTEASTDQTYREVKYRHSPQFVPILQELGISLVVSTYQAGKLVTLGTHDSQLAISLHNFDQAMGVAVHPRRIAVGTRGAVWILQNVSQLAPQLEPAGRYDACYLTRQSVVTGDIQGHEMAWIGDELWIVNTLFSCLCTVNNEFSFVPRWQPPFVRDLSASDRCHLNGMATDGVRPLYVTAMAETNELSGWRAGKATSGCLIDVASGQSVCRGLCMPHSPRVYGERVWLLNSGHGTLEAVDPATGGRNVVAAMPGYTRGLAFHTHYAFVGLSRIRETSVFGGVPIADHRDELKCAVAVVDLRSGQTVAFLEFETGVEEIFDVQVLPGCRTVSMTGPLPAQDDARDVWVVPTPGQVPASAPTAPPATPPAGLSDDDVTVLVRSALALQQHGRAAEAMVKLQAASAARPQSAEVLNLLGNAAQEAGRQDLAVDYYRRGGQVNPRFAPTFQNLGYLLINMGQLDEGLEQLGHAQRMQPNPLNEVMLATSLPVVYQSAEDVRARRARIEREVQRLVDRGLKLDVTDTIVPTNFFAAYQGVNDLDLQRNISRLYRAPQPVAAGSRASTSGKIRVGFLSSHFCDHTIGCLNIGRVTCLDRSKFEVTVAAIGVHDDMLARGFKQNADRYVELTGSLAEMRSRVAALNLDILVLADVGMNTTSYTLALSRMAPVQCVTWGHPVTTGNTSVDYFISSELLETPEADAHYSERLVRLANLGTYYYRPVAPSVPRTREHFGLDANRHVYLCPQTLFKLHPEFDPLVAEILRRDPLGDLVLLQGRHDAWTKLVRERFARTMPDVADRVRFLPPWPRGDFMHLNRLADVSLDTLHFGGGNTTYEALAVGTPVVTLPGPFLRSRIALALYRKMNLLDCVADSAEQYVELAVRLGTNVEARRAMSERIEKASDALFEDPAELREFERFLTWAAAGGPGQWQVHESG